MESEASIIEWESPRVPDTRTSRWGQSISYRPSPPHSALWLPLSGQVCEDGWTGRGVLTKIFRFQTFVQRRKGVDPSPVEDLLVYM
jgi:hypothetical protein